MDNKTIKILTSDKEDYEIDIGKLKEFDSLVDNSNIPLCFKDKVRTIINEELNVMGFYKKEIENDLNIEVDVGTLVDERLTAEQEDIMIEAGLEKIREEREN